MAQLKRLQDRDLRHKTGGLGYSDLLMPSKEVYDPDFWNREKGPRRLRPEQERFRDTKRFDRAEAKFDRDTYPRARLTVKELHCPDCDVWVRTRDQMQAHKEGKEHQRRTAKVEVFECNLCRITVPCQVTLDNHMRGKDHIKRAAERREARKARGEITGTEEGGYRTGPMEMARLNNNEREELARLRKEHAILQEKYKMILREREQWRRQARFCSDNHHHQEDRKTKMEPEEQRPSTSRLHKDEYFEYEEKDEYFECEEKVLDMKMKYYK